MSTSPSLDVQNTSPWHQGNWMYFPQLPSKLEEAMTWLLSEPRPSRNQNFDTYKDPYIKSVWRVIKDTHKMIGILSLPPIDDAQKAPWQVEWLTSEWPTKSVQEQNSQRDEETAVGIKEDSNVEDLDLEPVSSLPPFRYHIHIKWIVQDLTEYELFLTPFHFRLITLLDEALSRRIGDELDGPTPH